MSDPGKNFLNTYNYISNMSIYIKIYNYAQFLCIIIYKTFVPEIILKF